MKDLVNKIDGCIEKYKQEIIDDLRALVEIPSVRGEAKENMPFGEECHKVLEKSLEMIKREGFSVKFAPDNTYVMGIDGEKEKTIGIFAHGDVVSAEGEWLFGKPFELTEKEGFFIGRGCNDDKSGIVQMLYASRIIKDLGIPLKNNLMLFVGGNEESGMEDLKSFVENEKMPDVSIVPDGGYPYYAGEKVRVRVMLESVDELENIIDIKGGTSENVIPESIGVVYADKTEKTVKGIGGHAAAPDGSSNPLKIFALEAKNDSALSDSDKKIMENVAEILYDDYGTSLGIAHVDEKFGKLTCANGVVSVKDKKLRMALDIRCGISLEGQEVLNKIKEKTAGKWNVVFEAVSPGYLIDGENEFTAALCEAYKLSADTDEVSRPALISGGTYSRFLENSYSIGTVMYAIGGRMSAPDGHGKYHQPDESMSVAGFLGSVKTLTLMILKIDEAL